MLGPMLSCILNTSEYMLNISLSDPPPLGLPVKYKYILADHTDIWLLMSSFSALSLFRQACGMVAVQHLAS